MAGLLAPPTAFQMLRWTSYLVGIPYVYVVYRVDEAQEKVLEEHRKYAALKYIRVMKSPWREADPIGDERIKIAHEVEKARMKLIGRKVYWFELLYNSIMGENGYCVNLNYIDIRSYAL